MPSEPTRLASDPQDVLAAAVRAYNARMKQRRYEAHDDALYEAARAFLAHQKRMRGEGCQEDGERL